MTSHSTSEVEFEIGLVWDTVLLWYIKAKDATHFGDVFTGPQNQKGVQLAFQGSIKHEVINAKDWEEEGLL
jgi:hypothetical protein